MLPSDHDRTEQGGVAMVLEGRAERPVRPQPDLHTDRRLIFFLALGLVLGLAAGTQYVAWRFSFHPNLGAPLVVVGAQSARLLRATGVLATGAAFSALLVAPLRLLSGPLVLIALCAGLLGMGPVYAPYNIFVWYAANAAAPGAAPVFRVAWALVVTVASAARSP